MTTYEIPTEPNVSTVWTSDQDTGEPIEWQREPAPNERGPWCLVIPSAATDLRAYGTERLYWHELITDYGPVDDVHPDLRDLPPLPWKFDLAEDPWGVSTVVDADEKPVDFTETAVLRAVVYSVNEWAAKRITS